MNESQPYVNRRLHFSYRIKTSFAYARASKFRGENLEHLETAEFDSLPLCHKFAYGCQTVVEGQRHFAQHPTIAGYTTCSVNGLLLTNS